MTDLVQPQPAPIATAGPSVWQLVMADVRDPEKIPGGMVPFVYPGIMLATMAEREQFGLKKYGVPVQAHNGRDALIDAVQEALDLIVYLKQALIEKELPKQLLSRLACPYRMSLLLLQELLGIIRERDHEKGKK